MTESGERETTPHIRKMKVGDVEEVFNMGQNIPEFAVSESSSFWKKEDLERWVKEGADDVLLIAEADSKIVGFILTKFHRPTRSSEIANILVREEYQRKGIGEALVEETKMRLLDKGATYLFAVGQATNEASKRLFESAGFIQGHDMFWVEFVPE